MLKMLRYLVFTILASLLAQSTFSASSTPEKNRTTETSRLQVIQKNEKSESAQKITSTLSTSINELTSAIRDSKTNISNDDQKKHMEMERETLQAEKKTADETKNLAVYTDKLADFTCLLVIVGAVQLALFLWQLCLIHKASVDSRKSADAALQGVLLAKNEFIATHRPRFIVRKIKPVIEKGIATAMQYTVHNVGDTEGNIIATSEQVWMPQRMDAEPIPDYTPPIAKNIKLKCGEWVMIQHVPPTDVLNDVCFRMGFREEGISIDPHAETPVDMVFMGYIDYIDAIGQKHQTAFLREYNYTTKRFTPVHHPEYEYQD